MRMVHELALTVIDDQAALARFAADAALLQGLAHLCRLRSQQPAAAGAQEKHDQEQVRQGAARPRPLQAARQARCAC